VTIEVIPVEGLPEIAPGDDLASLIAPALSGLGVRSGDVVAVTQKIVSKAEGRVVPAAEGRETWIGRETQRVVARRADLVIAETRHGFVCANAGVDASNVAPGFLTLLPEDPDVSAEQLRKGIAVAAGAEVGVVVTDTFGRPWRHGVVNVAIGCAGLPALLDLRGSPDHHGRPLEATIVALADEIAAASGLVMTKAARVPVSIVRGVPMQGPSGLGRDLVRSPEEDLFRESSLLSISARRTIRSFATGDVPREAIEEAVRAACTAPAPHHTRPWAFTALTSDASKRGLLAATAAAWRQDLRRDGVSEEVIARRISTSDEVLGSAPVLIVPWITFRGSHQYTDAERAHAEQEMFLLSGGAAIQSLLLALHAQGLASAWISSTLFCQEETRRTLGMDEGWLALGAIATGRPPPGEPPERPALDLSDHLRYL